MPFLLKQLILSTTFNISLLIMLMVGIQNSSNKSRVNFYGIETINLPIGFIVGTSFLCGSLFGSLCNVIDFQQKKR